MREEILATLKGLGVVQTGHFRLTSGLHSPQYVQCARLFEFPKKAAGIMQKLAPSLPEGIETIVSPALGGITAGYELARLLGTRFIFAEKENSKMVLRRGFALHPAERVLVVEDVVTTGGSVKEVLALAQSQQAKVLAVAAIVDRSGGQVDFKVPFYSLLALNIEVYAQKECPFCAQGLPLQQPGSGGKKIN